MTTERTDVLNFSTAISTVFEDDQHVFDNTYIRGGLIVLYTIVFMLCFFGNLAVVLVVTLHWRMRNITKFFLGNLAFANLCVGIFCVYQSLTTYLYESWFFGDFMCKMHHFTKSLCHSASVFILIAIAVERYMVLLHPFKARRILTLPRLAMIIIAVWILSAGVSAPRLYYFGIVTVPVYRGNNETICIPKKSKYHSPTADTLYFLLMYILPLCILTVIYARIAKHLDECEKLRWKLVQKGGRVRRFKSSVKFDGENVEIIGVSPCADLWQNGEKPEDPSSRRTRRHHRSLAPSSSDFTIGFSGLMRECPSDLSTTWSIKGKAYCVSWKGDNGDESSGRMSVKTMTRQKLGTSQSFNCSMASECSKIGTSRKSCRYTWPYKRRGSNGTEADGSPELGRVCGDTGVTGHRGMNSRERGTDGRTRSSRTSFKVSYVQNQRRSAVQLLITIVVSFAVLNLPFHIRKLCLNYWPGYNANSDWSHLISPLTFLLMYTNCAINPILYAFMSDRFRQSLRDLMRCRSR